MNHGIYMGNCLANISNSLEKLPPKIWYQTWQEVGSIMAMGSVVERHARVLQLSEILTHAAQQTESTKLPK